MTSQRKSDSEYADTLGGRLGEDKSTRIQKRLPTQNDEERLLPGSTIRSDPAAIRIIPGRAGQKYGRRNKPNIPSLKPHDTISQRARESGPVRAQGKADRSSNSQRSTRVIVTRPENGAVHDDQERPSKRRRRESQDTSGGIISILDDDIMEQIPPDNSYSGHSTRLSPSLSQHSERTKLWDPSFKRNRVDEYRDVERGIKPPRTPKRGSIKYSQLSSDGYYEERFTEDAARERRGTASKVEPESTKIAWPDRVGKHEAIESVEVHPRLSEHQEGPSLRSPSVGTDQNHPDNPRDSPDELQGGATVQPAPNTLKRDREKETTIAMSEAKEHPGIVGRLASPSDIQPTVFTGSSQNHRKSDKRRKAPATPVKLAVKCFYATFVRFGPHEHRSSQAFEIGVETTESTKTTETSITFPWNGQRTSLERLDKVVQGEPPSRRVRLQFSRKGGLDNEMDMEFCTSEEQETLCNLLERWLHGQHVRWLYRQDGWLKDSFMKRAEDLAEQKANGAKRLGEDKQKPILYRAPEVAKRVKLSDSLQDNIENTAGQIQPSDTALVECSKSSATKTSGTLNAESTRELPSNEQEADKAPVKKLSPRSSFSNRATRSMSRRAPATTVVCDDEVEDDGSQPKAEETDKIWRKPLVYPRFGKKKAEVDAQDRERLRDNEFLNDNLIGFYMRFLEDHLERTNKDVAKRVYFFNSYFFATLTNVKGRRNINYEGVQKWTRAVDIFGFDYIVVPINENAHWYVAIICNLPNLPGIADKSTEDRPSENDKNNSAAPESEGREIPETPEPIEELPAVKETKVNNSRNLEPAKDEATRRSLESMSLLDKEESKDGAPELPPTEWPEQEENLAFSPAKFSSPAAIAEPTQKASLREAPRLAASPRKGSKKAKPSGKPGGAKFDIRQATIITFDSLDLSRSPTISNLRDYLYEEAKSKRGIEIDRSLIRGMRARAIPLQSNYSDCGLYLLAYLEKFVQNPDLFVKKLLRKEMKTQDDWPLLRSGILRRRLRDFLDDLYDEQADLDTEKDSEKRIMADRYPISYLLGSSASTSAQNEECSGFQEPQVKVSSNSEIDPQKYPPDKRRPASTQSSPAAYDGGRALKTEKDGEHKMAPSLKDPGVEIASPNATDKIEDEGVEVQVPDSQEVIEEISSHSAKIPKEEDGSPSNLAAMKPVDHKMRSVDDKKTKKAGQPAKLPTVEVQIIPPSYQGDMKYQRSARQKPK